MLQAKYAKLKKKVGFRLSSRCNNRSLIAREMNSIRRKKRYKLWRHPSRNRRRILFPNGPPMPVMLGRLLGNLSRVEPSRLSRNRRQSRKAPSSVPKVISFFYVLLWRRGRDTNQLLSHAGQERKRSQQESSPGAQYQSFSSVETPPANPASSPDTPTEKDPARTPNLYQQFANERDKEEQAGKANNDSPRDKPRSGNTVYVSGNKVTEDFLKKHFIEFGEILNISMEIEKGRGFITFSKTESADKAISEVRHGNMLSLLCL